MPGFPKRSTCCARYGRCKTLAIGGAAQSRRSLPSWKLLSRSARYGVARGMDGRPFAEDDDPGAGRGDALLSRIGGNDFARRHLAEGRERVIEPYLRLWYDMVIGVEPALVLHPETGISLRRPALLMRWRKNDLPSSVRRFLKTCLLQSSGLPGKASGEKSFRRHYVTIRQRRDF